MGKTGLLRCFTFICVPTQIGIIKTTNKHIQSYLIILIILIILI